jgi:glycosyltransferase involved in cell wall biosynthesis
LQLRHSDLVFAGTRRGEELATYYASADIFLFPSCTETFGNVVTEALASGLVVAGYDYAALRQHVRTGINGFVANFGDKGAFLQMAQDVISRRAGWASVRAAARSTAQTITWDVIVAQFEAKLASIVKTG